MISSLARITRPTWLVSKPIRDLLDVLGDARFVGGAVRDTVLGRPIGDLDLATPLRPDAVMARLTAAGLRVLPTGLAHGTVTTLLPDGPVEITSLRRDLSTDGRHAVIGFTDDWAEDSARRDFTMNALYLDAEGGVWDYQESGIADCRAGRVRFIGDPQRRLTEDLLRLLRFYRFHAHYGRGTLDPSGRQACRDLAPGLGRLARERIRAEILKLLLAPDPVPSVSLLIADGIWARILPSAPDLPALARLCPIEPVADPIRRLASVIGPGQGAEVAQALRLSTAERDRLVVLTGGVPPWDLGGPPRVQRQALYRLGADHYRDLALLGGAPELLGQAQAWVRPIFPLGGADLLAAGLNPGPQIGALLAEIEHWWREQDFTPDRAACLTRLGQTLAETITPPPLRQSPLPRDN